MNKICFLFVASAVALSGCKPEPSTVAPDETSPAPLAQSDVTPSATQPKKVKPTPKPITPERIAAIADSGRDGLWSDVTEVCSDQRVEATLTWNVQIPATDRVVLYVLGKDGSERSFGQGGLIGEKKTGPWVGSGTTFKLRDRKDERELATLVISEKSC